jgi:DNA-binding NtrC family response regulator
MSVARILIVDDEPQLRELLAGVLAERGLKTLQAGNGLEALSALQSNTALQFVLSDVKMPGMTGYEMVEQALAFRPELKVLMMTAYVTDLPTPQALRAREIRTLTKPFEPERMVELVFDMLSRP